MSHQCSEAQAVRPEEKVVLGTEGEEGDHEGEHDGEGERKTMKVLDPVEPREQEVAEHFLTHLMFRNWCRHCARGRGVEMPHKMFTGERTLPEVHYDFCFMGMRLREIGCLQCVAKSDQEPRRSGGSVRRAAEAGTLSSPARSAAAAAMEWWRGRSGPWSSRCGS